jgi:regulator of replication initiation timing
MYEDKTCDVDVEAVNGLPTMGLFEKHINAIYKEISRVKGELTKGNLHKNVLRRLNSQKLAEVVAFAKERDGKAAAEKKEDAKDAKAAAKVDKEHKEEKE